MRANNLQRFLSGQLWLACVILLVALFPLYSNSLATIEFRFLLNSGLLLGIATLGWWRYQASATARPTPTRLFLGLIGRAVSASALIVALVFGLPEFSARAFNSVDPLVAFPALALLGMLVMCWRPASGIEMALEGWSRPVFELCGWIFALAGLVGIWGVFRTFSPVEPLLFYLALCLAIPIGVTISCVQLARQFKRTELQVLGAWTMRSHRAAAIYVAVVVAAMLPLPIYLAVGYEALYVPLMLGSIVGLAALSWNAMIRGAESGMVGTLKLLQLCSWGVSIAAAAALSEIIGFRWYYIGSDPSYEVVAAILPVLIGVAVLSWRGTWRQGGRKNARIRLPLEICGRTAAITAAIGLALWANGPFYAAIGNDAVYYAALTLGVGTLSGISVLCKRRADADNEPDTRARHLAFAAACWVTGFAGVITGVSLLQWPAYYSVTSGFEWAAVFAIAFFVVAFLAWNRGRHAADAVGPGSVDWLKPLLGVPRGRANWTAYDRTGPFGF